MNASSFCMPGHVEQRFTTESIQRLRTAKRGFGTNKSARERRLFTNNHLYNMTPKIEYPKNRINKEVKQ
eukprot:4198353-Amphidinium_carterae.1